MKWSIVADSSCDMPEQMLEGDIPLLIAPLTIHFNDKEFVDNEHANLEDLRETMSTFKGKSSSSCPSPGDFREKFLQADNTICVCMTSALSGTYNSAVQAKNITNEEHPHKNISVIDSRATAGCMQLIIEKAAKLIKENKTFEEVAQMTESYARSLRLVFTLSSFDNLINNGRMSRSAATIASILGIKPIAKASPLGEIEMIAKARGEKNAVKKLMEIMREMKPVDNLPVIINHNNNMEFAKQIKDQIVEACKTINVRIVSTKVLCSYYTDNKGIIISF